MKPKNFKRKLVLKKQTVVNLASGEMSNVAGGGSGVASCITHCYTCLTECFVCTEFTRTPDCPISFDVCLTPACGPEL